MNVFECVTTKVKREDESEMSRCRPYLEVVQVFITLTADRVLVRSKAVNHSSITGFDVRAQLFVIRFTFLVHLWIQFNVFMLQLHKHMIILTNSLRHDAHRL